MPGARILRTETTISTASVSAEYLDKGHPEQPDVGIDARRVDVRAQRRVHEPAGVRRDPSDQRPGQDRTAEQVAPVAVGGQPREGEVSGAEHLRSQVDRYALHHGDGEQEKHDRPMHREDLVVGLRVHEGRVGRRELTRVSIPSSPPIAKNANAVAMKRTPMTEWLTAARRCRPGPVAQIAASCRCSRNAGLPFGGGAIGGVHCLHLPGCVGFCDRGGRSPRPDAR